MTLSRRQFFTTTAIVALAGAGSAGVFFSGLVEPAKADAPEPDQAELAKAGPEGDIVLCSDKAPVRTTIAAVVNNWRRDSVKVGSWFEGKILWHECGTGASSRQGPGLPRWSRSLECGSARVS